MDVKIHTNQPTTIRELEPGQHYITATNVSHGRVTADQIRRRTDTPFVSLTLMGSKVSSFPSDRCYPVSLIANSLQEALNSDE